MKFTKKEEKETLEAFIKALHGRNGFLSKKVMQRILFIYSQHPEFSGLDELKKTYLSEMRER